MTDRAILYRDGSKEYRWVRSAANGEKVAASTESYRNKMDAIANYERVSGPDAPLLVDDGESGLD